MYPPILATRFTRSDESVSEDQVGVELLTGEFTFGEVAGERGGAPMTWTITCVSTL